METAKNDITGDEIKTKTSSDAFRDGWDRIFGKKVLTPNDMDVELNKNDTESKEL